MRESHRGADFLILVHVLVADAIEIDPWVGLCLDFEAVDRAVGQIDILNQSKFGSLAESSKLGLQLVERAESPHGSGDLIPTSKSSLSPNDADTFII